LANEDFYNEQLEQSRVKTDIVLKYFQAWSRIMLPRARSGRIAYIDLFSGPGLYKDGTLSTPLRLLDIAVGDEKLSKMLVTIFNDKKAEFSENLAAEIAAMPGIDALKYPPQVYNLEVGQQIADLFGKTRMVPTLFFVDPWGYKGLSLDLIGSVTKNWGCDCVFFFNYNRIRPGVHNPKVEGLMEDIFGEERMAEMVPELKALPPEQCEMAILEYLADGLREVGGRYVLPFQFLKANGVTTSHHLIFVSKSDVGYGIMKEIMATESSRADQGVPSFAYSPAEERYTTLWELSRPLDDLEDMLLDEFSGRTIRMVDIYRRHNVGRPYIRKNYKRALINLEAAGKIVANPDSDHRRRNTFADTVMVVFPKREK